MPHAYTKDQFVEQPAIRLSAEFSLAVFDAVWNAATITQLAIVP